MSSSSSCQFGMTHRFFKKNQIFSKINKYTLTIFIFLLSSCDSTSNTRNFNFNYIVELEHSNNKKIELWLPVPQSNEVQTISNLSVDATGLEYEIKDEKDHGNKYLYVFSKAGISEAKTITMSFDVLRQEHQNVEYSKVCLLYTSPSPRDS